MTPSPETPTVEPPAASAATGRSAATSSWPAPGTAGESSSKSPSPGRGRTPREWAEWWLRPVIEARTWVAVGYLFVGVVWAPLMFVVTVAVIGLTFSLSLVVVGLVLVPLAFGVINGLARIERARATWIGAPIPPRPMRPRPTGVSWWRRTVAPLSDPTRWRQVAFVMASLIAMPVLFGVAMVPWGLVAQLPAGIWLLGLILAVLVAGGVARLSVAVAGVAHRYVAWFLGPDSSEELQQRVDELSGQRQAILDAVAAERRRIERNLHDGVQQQLVAIGIDIGRAAGRVDAEPAEARALLDEARDKLRDSIGELRLIGRGLHPSVLGDRGLDAALSSVVAGGPIPITVDVDLDGVEPAELPDDVATTAYYVVNEAVANVYKHSRARGGSVRISRVETPRAALVVEVRDDGRGGANPAGGSGMAGMRARVEGVDGRFDVRSPKGGPTEVVATVPIGGVVSSESTDE
ncbi:MAG: sensor domain-containing protein [Actinomycetota bacterium]